ncbi:phage antirepressor [Catenuloplanes indicus]|uniref:Prophage antirepressor-like protein n=1 Tax=Catenuloplanes indicus TaxID=137267 RepID=A0AAE4AUZ3_9ACTN|nr:phage antirepressor KilAC domain-containing protein [Catenuloplanes indicus]MDQ0363409.1 prophage antirepressor-like protein [Catenuloplanes indicus]
MQSTTANLPEPAAADPLTFTNPDTGEQIQTITADGTVWIVAAPVARALGYRDANDLVRNLDADERGTQTVRTPGGSQVMTVISEPGLYRALATRRSGAIRNPQMKDRVERFQRWVFHEVIPAAARGGRPLPRNFAEALQLAADQARAIEEHKAQIAELEPRAAQADHYRAADTLVTISSFANDLQLWAKETHNVRILHEHVFNFMAELGLLIRGNTLRNNQPTANAIDRGLLRPKHTVIERTAGPEEKISARLTQKGVSYVWDKATARIAANGNLAPSTALATTN